MLAVCDEYALEYCKSFNAQKSICMTLLPRRFLASQLDSCGFSIGSRPMEFVNSYLHLVRKCVTHDSTVICSVASYGIQYGRNMSCFGQNVLFCMRQYNCSLSDTVSSSVSVDNIVHRQYVQSLASVQKSLAECLRECIMIREGLLILAHDLSSVVGDILFLCRLRSDWL